MVFSQNMTHSRALFLQNTLYLESILLGPGRQADERHPAPGAWALQPQQKPCESPAGQGRDKEAYHHLSVLFIHLMSFKIVHQLPENITRIDMD